jgi:hypothetical protein
LILVGGATMFGCGNGASATAGAGGSGGAEGGAGEGVDFDDAGDAPDVCGNGLDDDGSGAADDGCGCEPGESQSCYAGAAEQAGVGVCALGTQVCEASGDGELGSGRWGDCVGSGAPETEICGDAIDGDCDGAVDCDACSEGGVCSAGGDALDGSGGAGGADSGNGDSNGVGGWFGGGDGNGGGWWGGDGYGSVGSGLTAADPCCAQGTKRWCDSPVGCRWGKQTCGPDGQWGTCHEVDKRPEGCSGKIYNILCCLDAPNACCQNYPSDTSMGECAEQLDCEG